MASAVVAGAHYRLIFLSLCIYPLLRLPLDSQIHLSFPPSHSYSILNFFLHSPDKVLFADQL